MTVAVNGALDEGVQSFFPYRAAAVTDWVIDVAAAGLVSALLWRLWPGVRGCYTTAWSYQDICRRPMIFQIDRQDINGAGK